MHREEFDFSQAPDPKNPVETLLKLVGRTELGRKLLTDFLPLLQRGEARVEGYPETIVIKLREVLGPSQPIGAAWVWDPVEKRGVVYLDFSSPIGALAPFLVHEMVHALDPEVRSGGASILEVETRAFRAQNLFQSELKERFPHYEEFLKTRYPQARILHELLEDGDLAEMYGKRVA
jgi:hypothetical protein